MKSMQDIDVQKIKTNIGNQFDTVLVLANRVREIRAGHLGLAGRGTNPSLQAMIEVETGLIGREKLFNSKVDKQKVNKKTT
jgi:DNA-directed RNA polymerase subunit K/omega